jgi:hypothetical protein
MQDKITIIKVAKKSFENVAEQQQQIRSALKVK